jgi:hypothetical protein
MVKEFDSVPFGSFLQLPKVGDIVWVKGNVAAIHGVDGEPPISIEVVIGPLGSRALVKPEDVTKLQSQWGAPHGT